MNIRLTLACLLALVACSKDDPTGPPPPPPVPAYELTYLAYEDVIPNTYRITISNTTFQGGPALWTFGPTGDGALQVLKTLTAVAVSTPDSSQTARITILTAGTYPFQFTRGDSGRITLDRGSPPWPFALPTILTDSVVTQYARDCFDAACENRTVISTRWSRIQ